MLRVQKTLKIQGLASSLIRIFAILVSVALAPATFAQVSLSLGDTTLAAGSSGSIQATLVTDGSAVALQFDVLYDPTRLTLGTVNGGAALTGNHSIASNPISAGRDRIVITTSPVTALGSGLLATINLSTLASAPAGTTQLTFDGVVISDNAAQPITPASLTPGTITINAVATPMTNPPEVVPATPLWSLLLLVGGLLVLTKRYRRLGATFAPALALGLCLGLCLLLQAPLSQAQGLPGDANNDGVINAEDVRLIVERILERGVLPGDGDCNRDSTINVLDTVCSQIPFVPGETAPIILGPGDRSIPADVAFEMNLFAADPDTGATQSWELISGPTGLAVSTDGVLTWTPGSADEGGNPVGVRVTDDTARTDEATFSIVVFVLPTPAPENGPPQLTIPNDQILPVGTAIAAQANATDPDVGDTLTFRLINGPDGMTIDPGTGALSWTPQADQAGTADVVIEVSDASGESDFGSFMVEATPLNGAPVATDDIYIARKGETLVIPAPEGVIQNDEDPNDDPLNATRLSDPGLGTIDSFNADGSFSYTPTEPVGISIGMEEECSLNISGGGANSAIAAADVDNDGAIELAEIRNYTTFDTEVFLVDPATCVETRIPVTGMGVPYIHGMTTAVNLDDDPELELVKVYHRYQPDIVADQGGQGTSNRLYAVNIDGTPLDAWTTNHAVGGLSAKPTTFEDRFNFSSASSSPLATDLNGDGNPELLLGYVSAVTFADGRQSQLALVVWDGRSGNVLWEFVGDPVRASNRGVWPVLVDLDLDGDTEIVFNHHVLDHDGNLLFDLPHDTISGALVDTLTSAVANFDNDAFPEIIAYDESAITLYSHEGQIQWRVERALRNFGFPYSGITIAELDGDPLPEFVFTANADTGNSAVSLFAFDDNGDELWGQADRGFAAAGNGSEATTPVAFDFDGDGIDELVQQKGAHTNPFFNPARTVEPPQPEGVYIFDGETGDTLDFITFNASANSGQHPLTLADVDGDGSAEIIVVLTGGLGRYELRVLEGLPGETWPGARGVRYQSAMHATYRNSDGSIPNTIEPHWLQPGRNAWNRVVPDRDPFEPETDSFTYQVSDGSLDSNTATVNLEVRPAGNPPFFLSEPDSGTSRGIAYEYTPLIVDVDPGDEVTLTLAHGPSGMTLDPDTGTLNWYPESVGEFPVSILATDTLGLSSAQIFRIAVGDPVVVPSVVGSSESAAEATLTGANLSKGSVFIASSPTVPLGQVLEQSPPAGSVADFGAPVQLTLSDGPAPLDRDDDSDTFSENEGDCDDSNNTIFPGAPDGDGDGIDQDCDGIDGNKTLVAIEISPDSKRVLAGEPTPLTATGIFDDGTAQNLTEVATWTRGPTFSSSSAGDFTAQASFRGVTGTANFTVLERVAEDLAPEVRIDLPEAGSIVTAPTDIAGLISDLNLLRWELSYRYAGESDYVLFAEGSNTVSSGGAIDEFDPTVLINGIYEIRLRAYDAAGNLSEDSTTVQVEEQLKVGNFSLRYVDLELPLNGIPISLVRTYDSRDKRKGDFGVGWRLGVNSIEIRTNRELGTGWQVLREGLTFGLVETDVHLAAVRLPGGRIEAFEMVVGPSVSPIVPFPPFSQSVSFRPLPGTVGRLESLEPNNISILDGQPGPVNLRLDGDGSIYNPTLFRYTAPDGTKVDLDTVDGVQRAETPGGQVLTFTPTSISHSNGTAVDIERDDAGRITRITDPGGFSQSYTYDANGDLRAHSDQEGFVTRFDYDSNHNVINITDPLNRTVIRNEYDDKGRMIRATNANGESVQYEHDVDNRRELVTDPDGFVSVYEYDSEGNVIRVTDPLGGVTTSQFDAAGNQISTTNAEGETTSFTYDARRNLLSVTDPIGAVTRFTYDEHDYLLTREDALGRVTAYSYDIGGRVSRIIDAAGQVALENVRDPQGNLVATTNARGHTRRFAYDSNGYQTELIDGRGGVTQRQYDANGRVTGRTDARGGTSSTTVDGRGFPGLGVSPVGDELTFTYDAVGELTSVSDELGNRTLRTVDAQGRVLRFETPDGRDRQMRFDARGNRTGLTDASGREYAYEYDALGRATRITLPLGGFEATTYDGVGRKTSETDPEGNTTQYEYDVAGRNTAVIDALGQRTEFSYDLVGNLVSRLDARGNRTEYAYDALDRLTETRYPDGSRETVSYDPSGNVTAEVDRLGRTKSYTYDPNDNLLSVTDIDGQVTTFAYDANNNRIAQTDANGHTTRMEYDASDRLIEKRYPDGSSERYEYDAGGRVARTVLPDGKFIDASYDGFGRPTGHNLNGEATESFTYDGAGRLTQAVNLWGTVDYSYDLDGRIEEIRSEGGHLVRYTYDLAGNRTSISTQLAGQSERITAYSYDVLNRLESVVEPDGDTTAYTYDPVGNVASITYPSGVVSTFTYDVVNQLTRIEHRQGATILASYDYTLDVGGRRLRVDHANSESVSYSYDSADRLLQETHRDAGNVVIYEQTFTYDAVGNRLTQRITGQAQTVLAYDSADKLLSSGATSFAYDANGRLTSKSAPQGTVSYAYDVEGQLLRVTTSAGTVTYAYDANGKRRQRTAAGIEQNYLLDEASLTGYDQTLLAFDENDAPLAEYHWGDRLLSADDGSTDRYYHHDASKNTRLLTDAAGSVSDRYDYDAFGNVRTRTGTADSPYGFAGEWQEEAEGLVFLRARFYDPESGRFISRDPFGGNVSDPVSLHRYLYANANPIMNRDPSGQLTLAEQVQVGAILSGTIAFVSARVAGAGLVEAIGRGIIGAAFGAVGGFLGAQAAVGVELVASTRAFASLIANHALRRGIVVLAHATAQGAISAVWGVIELATTLDLKSPKNTDGGLKAEAIKLFMITFVMEFITNGYWQPSIGSTVEETATRTVRLTKAQKGLEAKAALESATKGPEAVLFKAWQKTGGEDVIDFLSRVGQGRSVRSKAANRLLRNLNDMRVEAEEIIIVAFPRDLKIIGAQGGNGAFVAGLKSGMSLAFDAIFP